MEAKKLLHTPLLAATLVSLLVIIFAANSDAQVNFSTGWSNGKRANNGNNPEAEPEFRYNPGKSGFAKRIPIGPDELIERLEASVAGPAAPECRVISPIALNNIYRMLFVSGRIRG
ncbi:unnamed protein product [Notodromas monacha]|uniref:Uncharacterized protein n=1 Tax=Notodromas monacha TaxID=399045 RepID=A0A7R9GAI6_9CRUS|nr:unnamed protein product [Notodromas monacha]CAG0915414.1 unnamed protein product [Notodromas monacha]